jgi:hypothetical protein
MVCASFLLCLCAVDKFLDIPYMDDVYNIL